MRPSLKQIFDEVLRASGMSEEYYNENKKSRLRRIITIRQVVSLIGQDYGYAQRQIGEFLGVDHATVYNCKMMARRYCDCEREYSAMVAKVTSELNKMSLIYGTAIGDSRCYDCDVFKNRQGGSFLLGFHCPIKNEYVKRDEFACEYILADNMPF